MRDFKSLIFTAFAALTLASPAYADFNMKAGNVMNHSEAEQVCPKACNLSWNGHWTTIIQGRMSICSAKNDLGFVIMDSGGGVEAGPIWNNSDAGAKCPSALSKVKWNGHWTHQGGGAKAVCGCTGNAQRWQ